MRVIVTGATGFLGSAVVEMLIAHKIPTFGIARGGSPPFFGADISKSGTWQDEIINFAPTHVFHVAGSVAADESILQRANVITTRLLIETLNAIRPWLLSVGSGAVYGDVEAAKLPVTEESSLNPLGAYARSKLAQEAEAMRYKGPLCLARLANLLGPSQSSRFVIGRLLNEISHASTAATPFQIIRMGNLDATRDFLNVRDAASALYSLAQSSATGIYNVGSGQETRLRDVVAMVKALHGGDWEVIEEAAQLHNPIRRQALAIERIHRTTGWLPQHGIKDTIQSMVASIGD